MGTSGSKDQQELIVRHFADEKFGQAMCDMVRQIMEDKNVMAAG